MRKQLLSLTGLSLAGFLAFILFSASNSPTHSKSPEATIGGELTFTVRTIPFGGNYAPKHVLAIWVEDVDGFIKTRKAMANQRKQYLYTWKAASNYNVVDAITGSTLNSHQTHTVSWDFLDLDGNLVPDGEYTVWVEFTDKHDQGPVYTLTFDKGPDAILLTPPDEPYFKDLEFEFTPFIAEFSVDATNICQWGTVTFTDESVNADSWEWDFGDGAAPATAATAGPHTVYYTTPGLKTVSLTINGSVTETKEEVIEVAPNPEADFEFAGMGLTVDFSNTSINATTYLWDFGDGDTSTDNNPQHTYTDAGTFTVSLTASFDDCNDNIEHEVSVPLVSVEKLISEPLSIYPNPTNGIFNVSFNNGAELEGTMTIYNPQGKLIKSMLLKEDIQQVHGIDLSNQPKGIYMINYKSEKENFSTKVILK